MHPPGGLETCITSHSTWRGSVGGGGADQGAGIARAFQYTVAYGDDVRVAVVSGHDSRVVSPLGQPVEPTRRYGVLQRDAHLPALVPGRETTTRTGIGQRPARSRDRITGGLAMGEQPGQQLEQDLRLGVTAHRADDHAQPVAGRDERRRECVRRPATWRVLRRMPRLETEADAAV